MKIDNYENKMAFTSRRSISKMLELPATSKVAKDMNKLTNSLVRELYKKRAIIPDFTFNQLNKTGFDKIEKELGDRLIVSPETKLEIKDEEFKIPFKDIIKFFDIISENKKKSISNLIPQMNKIPSIRNGLDMIKFLILKNATFGDSLLELMGHPSTKEVRLVPLRQGIEQTAESLDELINPGKKEIADVIKKIDYETYLNLKDQVESILKTLKSSKNSNDMPSIMEQFQKIQNLISNI